MSRKEKAGRGIVTCENDDTYEAYSNHSLAFFRGDDLRIVFGQVVCSGGDPFAAKEPAERAQVQEVKKSVESRVAVTMSWTHAKLLYEMLGSGIKKFEELNGEIKQNTVPFAPSS